MNLPALPSPPARSVLLISLLILLQGCGSSGPARQDSYYRLDLTAAPAKASQRYPGTVLITRFDSRGFTGDRAMVFRDQGSLDQVQRYNYHLWAEAPPLSIQDLLARYLREAGVARFVVTPTQRVRADLLVSGTLLLMEHRPYDDPPRVLIEMEMGVVRADRREPLFLKHYQASQTTADNQVSSAIPAFDSAVTDIFSSFLGDLEATLPTLKDQQLMSPDR